MSAERRDGPGRPRDPGADVAIIRAAIDLLVERGVEQTSMERIAARAGVAKVTVYRRWKSKEDLLAEAIEAMREEIPTVVSQDGASLGQAVEELLPQWGQVLSDPRYRVLSARLLGAGPGYPALLEAYWRHHVLPRRERARTALAAAIRDGVLPSRTDLDVLLDMMTGAVIHHLLLEPVRSDAAELTEYLRRLLRQAGFRFADESHDEISDAGECGSAGSAQE